ncbi:MAG: BTAD domain-containing putative transcriptional regulator, partial [Eubacteriales bacterium]|nr:BTAD domain-containing putative transcriptional regulator [Eubacteriales bacterium]
LTKKEPFFTRNTNYFTLPNYASKSMQLLQMILLHSRDGISKKSLIDSLYGMEDVENKNGSLNNTIFRLRRQLRSAGLPECNYIVIQKGMCRWDDAIPVEVDCIRMEEYFEEGRQDADRNRKIQAFMEGCRLYTGEFLPSMIGEDWAAVRNVYYQNLYSSCLEELCRYLKEQERFEDIYQLTTVASEIYPFEDWQIWRIDSLISMERYREATEIYEKVNKLFFDEPGLPASPEMIQRFQHMAECLEQSIDAIEDIKQRLCEKEMADGAYYCTFPGFVDTYHVVSRMLERNNISVFVMLCTLKCGQNQVCGQREKDREISGILRKSIRKVLRKGDFYTKYNLGQYLVMLSGISQKDCSKVSRRIDEEFFRYISEHVKKDDYSVEYYVASIDDICPNKERETLYREPHIMEKIQGQ